MTSKIQFPPASGGKSSSCWAFRSKQSRASSVYSTWLHAPASTSDSFLISVLSPAFAVFVRTSDLSSSSAWFFFAEVCGCENRRLICWFSCVMKSGILTYEHLQKMYFQQKSWKNANYWNKKEKVILKSNIFNISFFPPTIHSWKHWYNWRNLS